MTVPRVRRRRWSAVNSTPYRGDGGCWIEIGREQAAYGSGTFFAEPAAPVELEPPSVHRAMEYQERTWIASWRKNDTE